MILVQIIFILCFCLYSASGQACDHLSNTPQCSTGERCSNYTCEAAVSCSDDTDCPGAGVHCRSDYCQPYRCYYTGQCVHGQVCKHHYRRSCVYPVLLEAKEGSNVTLTIAEPSTPGTYEDIRWLRDGTNWGDLVARYRDSIASHHIDNAKLNATTGALTLINVTVEEEGLYYYYFTTNSEGISDTGHKYEYRLKLDVTPEATIKGVSDKPVEVGTNVILTCTAIKVKASTLFTKMYWVIGGRNESGTITIEEGVLVNNLVHEVTKEDKWNPITCVVVPRFTDPITVEKYINPGYAPTGKPVIQVSSMGQYKGEKVTLTCENPEAAGNPPCNVYEWIKHGENISNLPNTQMYTFIMDEFPTGNYTCQCSNVFGLSEVSDVVEILYLGERPKGNNGGMIAGCVIGVLVLVALVVVGVFVCKRYKLNIQTIIWNLGRKKAGGKENEAYEIPESNLKPTNTDKKNSNTYVESLCGMGTYEDINEDEMNKGGEVGFVNTGFTIYEEVEAGKPDSHKPNVQAGKPDSHKPNVQAGKPDWHKPKIRVIRTTSSPTVVLDSN